LFPGSPQKGAPKKAKAERRTIMSSVVLLALLTVLSAEPGKRQMERWPHLLAQPGDKAEVYENNTPALPTIDFYKDFYALFDAKDEVGMQPYYEDGTVVDLAKGTPVLVVRTKWSLPPGERWHPMQVRVLDGPYKDRLWIVPEKSIARRVPPPESKPTVIEPAVRAATLLRSAEKLERLKRTPCAIDLYRQVVKEYRNSPQSETARGRLKALGAKEAGAPGRPGRSRPRGTRPQCPRTGS
jgi:hypothetical protein